ncbi:GntR family transcriptional regulator [Arthrobacter globiformis]|uniref:GntR family transcriptional regulator n=1 Tax=Arthrobacter globiformis TaxID=1665 RepID=UPI000B418D55
MIPPPITAIRFVVITFLPLLRDGEVKKLSRSTSLTDQAVELFREVITSGELVAGETYSANSLGERIGVSRTPAREALLQLARAGMIRIGMNKGPRSLRPGSPIWWRSSRSIPPIMNCCLA